MFGKNEIVGQKWFKEKDETTQGKLFVTSVFYTLQGEGVYAGMPAVFVRLAKCNLNCVFCFVGDTYITMAGGSKKKIKDVKVGDRVVTWDNGTWTEGEVTNTFESETDVILKMDFTENVVFCTPEHPFYVKEKGWVKAQDVLEGDTVLHYPQSERMRMYNPMKNPETAKYVGEKRKGKPAYLNVAWDNPEFRENNQKRMRENNPNHDPATAIKGYLNRKDHKKTYIEEILEETVADLPIKFVGHGDLVVNNLCPDFVVEGQKKLIEVWDQEQTEYWGRDKEYQKKRASLFAEEGYDVLFLPFTKKTDRAEIYKKCAEYVSNGCVLKSKTQIINDGTGKGPNGKAWVRLAGGKGKSAKVYNFEVNGTHNYVANNLLVHNCDTFFDDGDWLTQAELVEKIVQSIIKFHEIDEDDNSTEAVMNVIGLLKETVLVCTGGEPMLQENLGKFLFDVAPIFKATQIESNGLVWQDLPADTTLIVSPKCSEKTNKYLNPNQKVLDRVDALKFVISADSESPYHTVPDWAIEKAKKGLPVYVSPMNIYNEEPRRSKEARLEKNHMSIEERSDIDEVISFWTPGLLNMEENQANHEYAAKYALKNGLRLNLQMHLYCTLA